MSLIRYNNPWNLLNNLQRDLYDINPQTNFNCVNENEDSAATANWAPAVDISEDENGFTILADVPGVDPKNIDISLKKGVLTIKGERQTESVEAGENTRRVERHSGTFYRKFTLPESANADTIEARSEHGVLSIFIPKLEVAASRKIEVKH